MFEHWWFDIANKTSFQTVTWPLMMIQIDLVEES